MMIKPATLRDQVVACLEGLQTLDAYLRAESECEVEVSDRARLCKEASLTISVLVPKLNRVKLTTQTSLCTPLICEHCD